MFSKKYCFFVCNKMFASARGPTNKEAYVLCPQRASHGFACWSLFRFHSNESTVQDVNRFVLELERSQGTRKHLLN